MATYRDACVCIYEALRGEERWRRKNYWLDEETRVSKWEGIKMEGGQLVAISLTDNRLEGEFPDSDRLKALNYLTSLYVDSNFLKGHIPNSLAYFVSLQELNMAWNQLSGPIPEILYTLTQLRVLRLDSNQLTGEISESLGNLVHLRHLNLSRNQLSGKVPKVGQYFPDLLVCDLHTNSFEGEVPANAGEMKVWRGKGNFKKSGKKSGGGGRSRDSTPDGSKSRPGTRDRQGSSSSRDSHSREKSSSSLRGSARGEDASQSSRESSRSRGKY